MAFSFGFSGEDIEPEPESELQTTSLSSPDQNPAATASSAATGAFPVAGKPQLPPAYHSVADLLAQLPSKIAYACLDVQLDDGTVVQLPRRELWDVRVQLMAEDELGGSGAGETEGLGAHDVRTGVYEGGFKSWESSVDLVKVLAAEGKLSSTGDAGVRVIELGCGTALPSLALFRWAIERRSEPRGPVAFVVADYNPTVLQLVTLPNFLLTWALCCRETTPALADAFSMEGELELSPDVMAAFQTFLADTHIDLRFMSGGWSDDFIQMLYGLPQTPSPTTLILGAETIYSPFALQAFTETVFAILERERAVPGTQALALIGAKRLYFGVGGSLDDFVEKAEAKGGVIARLREETEGVRRGVVRCALQQPHAGAS